MRVLAVDAGNTRIKWGLHEEGSWIVQGSIPTARAAGMGGAWSRLPRPGRIVACNVAGAPARRALAQAARRAGRPVEFLASRARQCGVVNSYARPAQLGADRWAALIGAWCLYNGPCVVVNAGTTMTVDALDGEGVFLGGMIVPGPGLMRDSLARNTAGLRPRGGRLAYFPDCTADAIASGTANALAGAVERMHRFMRETGMPSPLVVLSGGAAREVAPALNVPAEVMDNLVLEGIVQIAHDSFTENKET
ncbi:MAG: type III pantothenate kinase [Burkholderiales bacterium]|nr:type III pantothenate kinase [Burkholderiales bacterium]